MPGTGTAVLDGQSLSGFDEGCIALLLVLAKARMQCLEWGLLDSGPFAPVIGAKGPRFSCCVPHPSSLLGLSAATRVILRVSLRTIGAR